MHSSKFKCVFDVHACFLYLLYVRDVVGMSWDAEVLYLFIDAFLLICIARKCHFWLYRSCSSFKFKPWTSGEFGSLEPEMYLPHCFCN
jgi:hypothetical protein